MIPLLLAVPFMGAADPPAPAVALPAEVAAHPGRLVKLTATTDAKQVRWLLASDDADLIPFPDGKTALFCAAKSGRYLVFAWTAAGDVPSEAARCVVSVGDPPPAPPPQPADALAAEFRKLLAADATPDKPAHLAQLVALYREAAAFADSADVKTAGELAARIRAAAGTLLPADALVAVRKRIADEIAKELPADGETPLDATARRKAAALFARIATSLEAAK
jgi:hypothetical protein